MLQRLLKAPAEVKVVKTSENLLNILVVGLLTQDNVKLLKQLESGLERKLTGIDINHKCPQEDKINVYITLLIHVLIKSLFSRLKIRTMKKYKWDFIFHK